MSERVIAIQGRSFAGSRDIVLKPDPNAPSVSEIVNVLKSIADGTKFDAAGNRDSDGLRAYLMGIGGPDSATMRDWVDEIDRIIGRLEEP